MLVRELKEILEKFPDDIPAIIDDESSEIESVDYNVTSDAIIIG